MNGRLFIPLVLLLSLVTACSNSRSSSDNTIPGNDAAPFDITDPDSQDSSEDQAAPVDDSHSEDQGNQAGDISQDQESDGSLDEGTDIPPSLSDEGEAAPEESTEPEEIPVDEDEDDDAHPDPDMSYLLGSCVDLTGNNEITLYWEPPSANIDGSPLLNLAGYRIFLGKNPNNLSRIIEVGVNTNPTIYNLSPGIWYFRVKVYNTFGLESNFSNEACAAL